MANFTGLAAARHEVLRRAGWNVEDDGLQRAPRAARDRRRRSARVGHRRAADARASARASSMRVAGRRAGPHARRRARSRAGAARRARRSSARRRATWRPARAIRSTIVAPRTRAARGSTWTARSGCGPPPCPRSRRRCADWPAPIRGRPTRTSGSTSRTTPVSPSCAHPAPHRAAMSLHASYLDARRRRAAGRHGLGARSRRGAHASIPLYALIRALGRTGTPGR